MEKLTTSELSWLREAADLTAAYYEQRGHRARTSAERELTAARSKQLRKIAEQLKQALERGDKRIEIE